MIILESSLKGSPQRSLFFREQLTLQQFRHHSKSGLLTSQGQKKTYSADGKTMLHTMPQAGSSVRYRTFDRIAWGSGSTERGAQE